MGKLDGFMKKLRTLTNSLTFSSPWDHIIKMYVTIHVIYVTPPLEEIK